MGGYDRGQGEDVEHVCSGRGGDEIRDLIDQPRLTGGIEKKDRRRQKSNDRSGEPIMLGAMAEEERGNNGERNEPHDSIPGKKGGAIAREQNANDDRDERKGGGKESKGCPNDTWVGDRIGG